MPELTVAQIVVTVMGFLLCAFILWWFLFSQRTSARSMVSEEMQEVVVKVLGGYDPESVILVQGVPAKLRFQRDEESECSEEIVIPDFGIKRTLPAFKTTTIDLQPEDVGEFPFHCGMGMMRGRIVVVPSEKKA